MRQRQQTRQDATYRSRKSVQTTGAGSVNTVHDLTAGGIGLRIPTGQGAAIDTTTAAGKLVFGIFAALA
jgi:DNA invertase Pin-like site-specific DNA recombinase